MVGVDQPPVTDVSAIVEAVRRRGSVHFRRDAIPGEFTRWRSGVRRAARAAGSRISVRRTAEFVLVESRDYEVSDEEQQAVADVMGAALSGGELSFEDALRTRRRQRLRVVEGTEHVDSEA
jgi:hypothetical protein